MLPSTGDYTLQVNSSPNEISEYGFELISSERITQPYTLGNEISGSLSKKGNENSYTFEGTAGQKLWLDTLNYSNTGIRAYLITPSGRQLFDQPLNSDRILTRLDETGTYTLRIDSVNAAMGSAIGDAATGYYSLRLLDWANATPIDLNSILTGKFNTTGGEEQLYRFNGEEGQRFYFASIASSDNDYYQLSEGVTIKIRRQIRSGLQPLALADNNLIF